MPAEILHSSPFSGEYTELHFGTNFNAALWVKFTGHNYQEWVGCFSKSFDSGLSTVLANEISSTAFIVAGGQGYLVHLNTQKLIVQLEDQPLIESAIQTTNPNYFIAGTAYGIYVLDQTGLVKEIRPDRIIDGIYFKSQLGQKAIGELATAENQYDKNVAFEFDLKTLQLSY
jgi:hypothetical protein